MNLTRRQFEVLQVMDTLCSKGYGPTIEEIGVAAGLRSTATVHLHISNLRQKGLVDSDFNSARSLKITTQGKRWLKPKVCPHRGGGL